MVRFCYALIGEENALESAILKEKIDILITKTFTDDYASKGLRLRF